MNEIPINIAVEDELSGAVAQTLLTASKANYHVGNIYGRGGFGYLKKTCSGWNNAARGIPFLLLTDLDDHPCPSALIDSWLGDKKKKHPNLLFRIAVKEVESWLLADRENFGKYLAVSINKMPHYPDTEADPKATLIKIAAGSNRKEIRSRLVPRSGSTAKQGPDYNQCLINFVRNHWNIEGASGRSPSLTRCVKSLNSFAPTW